MKQKLRRQKPTISTQRSLAQQGVHPIPHREKHHKKSLRTNEWTMDVQIIPL